MSLLVYVFFKIKLVHINAFISHSSRPCCLIFISSFKLPLHETISSTVLLVMKREIFHVSLQPAVIANKSISSLWWRREDSPFSGVVDVTQLRSFAARAAGLAASACGSAAPLLEVGFLTSHQSEGAPAQQPEARLPDKRTCGLTWWCITLANGMVQLWPFTFTLMTCFLSPLLPYSPTWLQRGSWRRRTERSWRR